MQITILPPDKENLIKNLIYNCYIIDFRFLTIFLFSQDQELIYGMKSINENTSWGAIR